MSNHVPLCQGMRFFIGFPKTINKPYILNQAQLDSLKTINKLCTLCLSSKPDTSLSPVAIVKSHGQKCQNYFCVGTSLTIRRNVARQIRCQGRKEPRKKMMDFDYCEEYSRSISNKVLLWQCQEKQIFISVDICRLNKLRRPKTI